MTTNQTLPLKRIISATLLGLTSLSANAAGTLEEGKLQVAMEVSYPPFESYEGDKIVGFDPELTALLSDKMGMEATLSDHKFTTLILGLEAKKFDAVISGLYITPERLSKADAIPYAQTGASIMVINGSEVAPKNEHELCGVKVGLQQGTSWVSILEQLSKDYCQKNGKSGIEVLEFPTAPEVTQALMSRNVQAQIEIAGAADMFVERTKGRVSISSEGLIFPQTLGIYVQQGNDALKGEFEQAMKAIQEDGSYDALITKYNLVSVKE